MKYNNKLDINTVDEAIMTMKLDMSERDAHTLLRYRDKFKLLEGEDEALVSLEQLWEVLDKPYGRYQAWLDEMVKPECEKLLTEISVKRLPTKGRPKNNSFVNTDTAKHLCMMSRTDAGVIARMYFTTVEKLFKNLCQHNHIRIDINQRAKDVSHAGFKKGGYHMGTSEKIRFHSLMKKIKGAINNLETNLSEYDHVTRSVKRMMLNGMSDEVILSAHI